jgi:hypothetical protein
MMIEHECRCQVRGGALCYNRRAASWRDVMVGAQSDAGVPNPAVEGKHPLMSAVSHRCLRLLRMGVILWGRSPVRAAAAVGPGRPRQ